MRKLPIVILSFLFVGCGGPTMSEADMTKAWSATSTALSSGRGQAALQGGLTSADATGSLSFDFPCTLGGTTSFSGAYDVTGSGNAANGTFDFDVGFSSCQSATDTSGGSLTIDGNLSYDGTLAVDSESLQYTINYQGSLTYAGDVSGSCDINVVFSMSASLGGDITSTNWDYSYSGTICGWDASGSLSGSYGGF